MNIKLVKLANSFLEYFKKFNVDNIPENFISMSEFIKKFFMKKKESIME